MEKGCLFAVSTLHYLPKFRHHGDVLQTDVLVTSDGGESSLMSTNFKITKNYLNISLDFFALPVIEQG
jgi:hypothetical protein